MFKPGDRIKCVDISGLPSECPLVLNREYIAYSIQQLCNCGPIVDIGIISPSTFGSKCATCFRRSNDKIWHFKTSRFIKVQEQTEYKVIKSEIEILEPCLS